MADANPLTTPDSSRELGLLIPCPADKFAEFISGLLGKPQIISGRYVGSFDIGLRDIENFFHLVDQRVKEQNRGNLTQFSAEIKYSDGTSVEVTALEELRLYSETRPKISIGVTLSWVYLVIFQGKTSPERQQIDVDIAVHTRETHGKYRNDPEIFYQLMRHSGVMSFRISHTSRTWGSDIKISY